MAGSRPSIQSVQRSLIIGVLAGLIFGCLVGLLISYIYIQTYPPVYAGGAYPNELAPGYQSNYLAMVIDSYIVNRQVPDVQKRLQSFDTATKVRALAERSVTFQVNGQGVEAQAVNDLAVQLKQSEGWSDDTVKAVIGELTNQYQGDNAKLQAIANFSNVIVGVVPVPPAPGQTPAPGPTTAPPTPPTEGGGSNWIIYCVLGLAVVIVVVLLIGNWYFKHSRKAPAKPQVVWEGEGPAPIKQWSGTYTLGQDNYDEFFTIETLEGDFLGESGMGILESIPGSKPKQVVAFDVGLFDKTDITTLSRVVMSEHGYYDEALQAKVQANPQAEAILAKPDAEFVMETSALRVVAKIDELEYGEGNAYFTKLKLSLDVFIREGADLKIGTMDVPDQYK